MDTGPTSLRDLCSNAFTPTRDDNIYVDVYFETLYFILHKEYRMDTGSTSLRDLCSNAFTPTGDGIGSGFFHI